MDYKGYLIDLDGTIYRGIPTQYPPENVCGRIAKKEITFLICYE